MDQTLLNKILSYRQASVVGRQLKTQGKKLVMVSGCFDLLHLGHMEFLSDAKALGDALLVSLGSDRTIKVLKGEKRPMMNENYRAQMLASLEAVDYVVIAKEEEVQLPSGIDFGELARQVLPSIFAINKGNRSIEDKKHLMEEIGGRLVEIEGKPVTSTTEIIGKIEEIF